MSRTLASSCLRRISMSFCSLLRAVVCDVTTFIGIDATSVAVHKYTKGFFGRSGRTVLLLRLSCENAQDGKIVLDLLKSGKGRLAVICNVPIIGSHGCLFGRAPPSSIK